MKKIILSFLMMSSAVTANASFLTCTSVETHQSNAQVVLDRAGDCQSGLKIQLAFEAVCKKAPCEPALQTACVVSNLNIHPGYYQACGIYFSHSNIFVVRAAQDSKLD
jgi:hypothetical protein